MLWYFVFIMCSGDVCTVGTTQTYSSQEECESVRANLPVAALRRKYIAFTGRCNPSEAVKEPIVLQ